jgi:hypothetical protein
MVGNHDGQLHIGTTEMAEFWVRINEPMRQLWQTLANLCGRSVVLLGTVDAGTTPAATNSQWVFETSVDVTLLLHSMMAAIG